MAAEPGDLVLEILGRQLHATLHDASLRAWLMASWSYPEHTLPPSGFTIRLMELADGSAPAAPAVGREQDAHVADLTLRFIATEGAWWCGSPASGLLLEIGDAGCRISLWGWDANPQRTPDLPLALQIALTESLRLSGLVPLHASVAERAGTATAYLATSGGGKSTTLLYAVRAGAHPIAEDLCWLEPDSMTVFGWDRAVRMWPETLARLFPDLEPHGYGPDGKALIDYGQVGAKAARRALLVRLAVLVRVAGGVAGWDTADEREVVRALWESTGVPLSDAARRETGAALERMVRKLELRRLTLGEGMPPE